MSSNVTIQPNEFYDTINSLLKEYGEDVADVAVTVAKKVANKGKAMVKSNGRPNWQRYKAGWAVKFENGRIDFSAKIYNKTDYQLTHLLEFGHLIRNGTRVVDSRNQRTRAFEHIKPVNDWVQKEYLEQLGKAIQNEKV